jgi:hypothetical protein
MATNEVKKQVQQIAALFQPFYGKRMHVNILGSQVKPFSSILENVRPATLQQLKGLEPDKRPNEKGTFTTPPSLLIEFRDGSLFLIIEDIRSQELRLSSITLHFDRYAVQFVEAA